MENKYQEAFNIIVKNCGCNGITKIQCINCDIPTCKVACSLSDIKELIDNYRKLDKAFDNACYLLSQCTQFLEVNGRKIKTPKEYKKFCMKYNVHKERG